MAHFTPDTELTAFIRSLPKTETHLHFEGALPLRLARRVWPEWGEEGPPWFAPEFRFRDFAHFQGLFVDYLPKFFTGLDRYHEAATALFADLAEQNVRYVETSFHLGVTLGLGVPPEELIAAIRSGCPEGMTLRIFTGMARDDHQREGMAAPMERLPEIDGLDGIDLHSFETVPMNRDWTPRLWRRVREAGKLTKAHAGEFCGPEIVRQVVEELGVRRVQHGVRAVEDPATLRLLQEMDVTLDVCPISNLKLGVIPDLSAHPLRTLLDAGIRCTVNTDDPFAFGNTLTEEYAALSLAMGFSKSDLVQMARNGFEVALMPETEKRKFLGELDALG